MSGPRRLSAVTRRRAVCVVIAATCMAGAGGCTDESQPPEPTTHIEAVDCPVEVELSIVSEHSCGVLVVPADRADPRGPVLRLLFLRVQPPAPDEDLEPIATVGYEVAHSPEIGDMAGIVGNSGREMIFLAQRGTRYTEPAVDCPTTDSERRDLATVAGDCRDRLASQGLDVGDLTAEQSARDLEDLRTALAVPRWNLVSWGSASLVLLEYLRLHPDRVAAAVLDSPQFPELDPVTSAPDDLYSVLTTLQGSCRGDARCTSILARARAADALTLRRVRDALSREGRGGTTRVLRLLTDPPSRAGDQDARDLDPEPWCLGYLSRCDDQLSLATYLSATCPRVPDPVVDEARVPGFGIEDPLVDTCGAWGMPSHSLAPVRTDVPVLVLRGDLDPFTPAALAASSVAAWPAAYLVVAKGLGHDVFGVSECLRAARNAWLLAPDDAPRVTGCHALLS